MQLIGKGLAVDGLAAGTGACGIAGLDAEAGDDAVPETCVVVALERECDNIPTCLWGLLGPELDLDLALGRVQDDLAVRRRLGDVQGRH